MSKTVELYIKKVSVKMYNIITILEQNIRKYVIVGQYLKY